MGVAKRGEWQSGESACVWSGNPGTWVGSRASGSLGSKSSVEVRTPPEMGSRSLLARALALYAWARGGMLCLSGLRSCCSAQCLGFSGLLDKKKAPPDRGRLLRRASSLIFSSLLAFFVPSSSLFLYVRRLSRVPGVRDRRPATSCGVRGTCGSGPCRARGVPNLTSASRD